jgi:hypothetical protein
MASLTVRFKHLLPATEVLRRNVILENAWSAAREGATTHDVEGKAGFASGGRSPSGAEEYLDAVDGLGLSTCQRKRHLEVCSRTRSPVK